MFDTRNCLLQKDAAKSADIERENLIEQQRKHEMKKRELMEKESMLNAQQSELELRISQAKDQKVKPLCIHQHIFPSSAVEKFIFKSIQKSSKIFSHFSSHSSTASGGACNQNVQIVGAKTIGEATKFTGKLHGINRT